MRRVSCLVLVIAGFGFDGCSRTSTSEADLKACEEMVAQGFLRIAESRDQRFQGKVQQATALPARQIEIDFGRNLGCAHNASTIIAEAGAEVQRPLLTAGFG